jgi:large subunit ribosomal protein L6
MSRIGKKPIAIPDGVKVGISDRQVTIEGPKGKLAWTHRPEVIVQHDDEAKQIVCTRQNDLRVARALHGTTRSVIENMIVGVTLGY